MLTFILRRLLALLPLLLVISFLTYLLQWAAPGDYYTQMQDNPAFSAEYLAQLRSNAGLDKDLVPGYLQWLSHAVRGDFGHSLQWDQPVFYLIGKRLLNTLLLSCSALALAWLVAVPLGVIAAVRRNTWIDKVSGLVAYFGLSIPSVFFALLMVLLAAYTGWFPIGDMRDVVNWDQMTMLERVLDILHHLALPVFVLSTISMASWMRQMRGSMVETLSQDYVRTAKAKGLSSGSVLFRHALRNAINPLVTLFGYSIAYVLNGSFLVEVVMNWPGMARLVVTALFNQDQPVVMGSVLMATILLVIGNTVADILLALTDPRIRLS